MTRLFLSSRGLLMNENSVKKILSEMCGLFIDCGETRRTQLVQEAFEANEEELKNFLVSNELWGGAGSIADEACLENKQKRESLEKLLIKLGKIQIKAKIVSSRTDMWVTAFSMRH